MRLLTFFSITALTACSAVSAQLVTEFRQPGDIIRVEIKFDGRGAPRIKRVTASLNIPNGATPSDQKGFVASFSGDPATEPSPNVFDAEIKVPTNAATGDYTLYVYAQAEDGWMQYAAGDQFQLHAFHIKNGRSFIPPTVTVTERR